MVVRGYRRIGSCANHTRRSPQPDQSSPPWRASGTGRDLLDLVHALLADINTELAKVSTSRKKAVEPVVAPESQLSVSPSDRVLVLKKVHDLTDRLKNSGRELNYR